MKQASGNRTLPNLLNQVVLNPLSRIHELPGLSQLKHQLATGFSEADLEGFRRSQRLAYACAAEIGALLQPGWSEKQTADLMDTYLRDHGVKGYFHKSFAWFGERSRFDGVGNYFDFLPSQRAYREGEVVILDTAPILDGYPSDIGYSLCKGENPAFEQALQALKSYRQDLLDLFNLPGVSGREIYAYFDRKLKQAGYQNRHRSYPLGALGHRLYKMPLDFIPGLLVPFSWQSYASLVSQGLFSEVLGEYHQGSLDGLWAIEPHLGADGFGAKFEEMLWVKDGKAVWLDEPQFYQQASATEKPA